MVPYLPPPHWSPPTTAFQSSSSEPQPAVAREHPTLLGVATKGASILRGSTDSVRGWSLSVQRHAQQLRTGFGDFVRTAGGGRQLAESALKGWGFAPTSAGTPVSKKGPANMPMRGWRI